MFVRVCWVADSNALTAQRWTSAPGTVLGRCGDCQGSCPLHGHSKTQVDSSSQVALGSTSQPARGSSLGACPLEVLRDQTWRWTYCHTFLMERTNPWPPLRARMAGGYHPTLSRDGEFCTDFVRLLRCSFLEWEVMVPATLTHTTCWVPSHLSGKEPCRQGGLLPGRSGLGLPNTGGSASISAHTCTVS